MADTRIFDYDKPRNSKSIKAFVSTLVRKYKLKGKLLLDVGCGFGYYANEFSRKGVKVIACDIRENAINAAEKNFGNEINWICGDALELKLSDKVDVVFASGFSLYNIEDLNQRKDVTKKLLDYLKNDGLLLFVYASNLTRTKKTWFNHKLADISNHLTEFGDINGAYITNIQAFILLRRLALSKWFSLLAKLFLKVHKRNIWIVVVLQKNK